MRTLFIRLLTTSSVALVIGSVVLPGRALAAFPGANGKIAFVSAATGNPEIYSMEPDGTGVAQVTNDPAPDFNPAWSPDGSKIAFESIRSGTFDIYSIDAGGSGEQKLTTDSKIHVDPAWSPDGSKIALAASSDGLTYEIYTMNADGSGVPVQVTHDSTLDDEAAWSPDGSTIAYESFRGGTFDIYSVNADGSGTPSAVTSGPGNDRKPNWSPDGSKIAFMSDRSGDSDVYSVNADGSGTATNLTNDSGFDGIPAWSPDGTQIAFMSTRGGNLQIYSMTADASTVSAPLTSGSSITGGPDWAPVVAPVVALFTAEFFPPLTGSTDPSDPVINTGKNGRVIPVKVRLDEGGTSITDQNAPGPVTIHVSKLASCGTTAGSDPAASYSAVGPDAATDRFRYDTESQDWIYNLDTGALGLVTGDCYRIGVSVNGTAVTSEVAVFQPVR
jgi:Tol biopolymer transport system component